MRNILIIGAGRSATSLINYLLERSQQEDLDTVVEELVPFQVDEADLRPTGGIHHAPLKCRIDLTGRKVDHLRAEVVGEERVVDVVAAQLQPLDLEVAVLIFLGLTTGESFFLPNAMPRK